MYLNLMDVVSIHAHAAVHFPPNAERAEPFYTREFVVTTKDGATHRITLYGATPEAMDVR